MSVCLYRSTILFIRSCSLKSGCCSTFKTHMKQQDMWMGKIALSLFTSIIQSAIDWVINGLSEFVWADYRQYWEFPIPGIYEDYSNVNLPNLSLMANLMRNIIGENHRSNRETAAQYKMMCDYQLHWKGNICIHFQLQNITTITSRHSCSRIRQIKNLERCSGDKMNGALIIDTISKQNAQKILRFTAIVWLLV